MEVKYEFSRLKRCSKTSESLSRLKVTRFMGECQLCSTEITSPLDRKVQKVNLRVMRSRVYENSPKTSKWLAIIEKILIEGTILGNSGKKP